MAFLVQKHHYSITPSSRAEKHPNTCAERNTTRLPSRKTPRILRGRCTGGIPGRKRYLFLRRMRYQPPAKLKNTPNPARKVLRGGSRQKKASFPARNGLSPASWAEKRPKSCAEGAPRRLQAEKGIFSCAEWDNFCREEY